MLSVNVNGKQINLKTALTWAAIVFGGYAVGANYPQLNPAQLIPSAVECVDAN